MHDEDDACPRCGGPLAPGETYCSDQCEDEAAAADLDASVGELSLRHYAHPDDSDPCEDCMGTGRAPFAGPDAECGTCGGSGRLYW